MKLRNKKTGEIKEWQRVGAIDYGEMNEVYDAAEYNSLAELNEEWEDYNPTEPLIKDEKIRKAVRAWAEATGVDTGWLKVSKGSNSTDIFGWVKGRLGGLSIGFEARQVEELEDGIKYTIEELCGEEE